MLTKSLTTNRPRPGIATMAGAFARASIRLQTVDQPSHLRSPIRSMRLRILTARASSAVSFTEVRLCRFRYLRCGPAADRRAVPTRIGSTRAPAAFPPSCAELRPAVLLGVCFRYRHWGQPAGPGFSASLEEIGFARGCALGRTREVGADRTGRRWNQLRSGKDCAAPYVGSRQSDGRSAATGFDFRHVGGIGRGGIVALTLEIIDRSSAT